MPDMSRMQGRARCVRACLTLLSFVVLFLLLQPATLRAQPTPVRAASETQLALRKLTVLGSALYVGAHPDDENTAMLAYLSDERLLRAAYLSITRGDGGQNLIGTEQGEMLGLLRTQELLAARRIDGAEQFFTRAIDFGYSKTPAETLSIWGREQVLADVVWVIRRFRPDVVITRFPTTGEGGHGHHTASAILAVEAFRAAADPARFPEQLRHVETWQPKRLMWNSFRPQLENRKPDAPKLLTVDLGAYNALLGKSYTEIAALSRSMHKSQGFGSAERRGSALNYLEHLAGDAPVREDFFEGIDTSWRRVRGGEQVGQILEEAARTYNPANPQATLPLLVRAHAALARLPDGDVWVAVKRRELLDVIRACSGLWLEAIAADFNATPGGEIKINTTLVNRSDFPLRLESVGLPFDAPAKTVGAELKNNQPVRTELALRIPADAPFSQPYWLRDAQTRGRFSVAEQTLVGTPENAPTIPVTLNISTGGGETLTFETPVLFRWTDRVRGEQYRPFEIVPPVVVNLAERTYVFPEQRAKPVSLLVKSNAANVSGQLRLQLPGGWRATPETIPVNLKNRGDEFNATFNVTPPADASTGTLAAGFDAGGRRFSRSMQSLDYPHIPLQTTFPAAHARLVRFDIARRGRNLGYVMGSGDEIPEALRQLGYSVALLSDHDLDSADFGAFDAIITGVRAYNTRPRLRQQQGRLLDYVERGGTLVVQYNTDDLALTNLGPYPFKLSRERVTVEESPVAFALPEHPLLLSPNRISAADFENWIQERGIYFASEWDARYQTPLAANDPDETAKRGGTLYARHGKGAYIYTGYAWFRQLPAGVPGAYRLFVNMIDAGK
ncbi:MAG TPA: PIG-L family deacetylase [Pyrinomonadaceae bacterium]|jgi:LmbE family N-acetylglucosaminyl deacetylase|nr:PIG-L family deacetylase [Pyrinomonadaceae bacterium]